MKKLSESDVALFFAKFGCELLGQYEGCGIPVKYKCSCGRIGDISLDKFKRRIKRKEGCFYCNKHEWTSEEDNLLREMYGKQPRVVISEKLCVSYSAIKSRAAFLKLSGNRLLVTSKARRGKGTKYSHDIHFFDKKTNISLYWAGFIAAGGCIHKKKNSVSIKLKEIDLSHLEKFQDVVCHTGVIHRLIKDKKVLFTIHGANQWIDNLKKYYNIIEKKSLILQPPNDLNDQEALAYIVGYIDGDSCLFNKGALKCSFIQVGGTEQMLLWIKDFFDKWCPPFYGRHANVNKRNRSNIFTYSIRGVRAKHLLEKLLSLDLPRLERKWI
jgi:hypothetical protein